MEMENIRYGKLRGYEGIFTTNANRLTQHISRILGYQILSTIQGGFQLEFVSISRVLNHMTYYKFECPHWWKIYFKKILYKICSPV